MNINLYINKQSARAEAPEVYSGSVGVLTVTLFGELDTSLVPVLRFIGESGANSYTAAIDEGRAIVPHEVIKAPGFSIAVGYYENDGEELVRFLPTEAVYIPVKENGYGEPDEAMSEEADAESLIGQILTEVTAVRGEITEAEAALAAEVSAARAELAAALTEEQKTRAAEDTALGEELSAEADARLAADNLITAALTNEKNERTDADTSLSNAIASERNARIIADDAFLLRISEEEEARVEKDAELETAINGKVDKETDKGLSVIKDVSVDNYTDDEFGSITELCFRTYTDKGIEVASFYGPAQVNRRFYSKAEVDALLAGISPGGDIDLEEYVKKEDGKGLSRVIDILIDNSTDVGIVSSIQVQKEGELMPISMALYNTTQIDSLLANYSTTAEMQAYIESTLLGGAW